MSDLHEKARQIAAALSVGDSPWKVKDVNDYSANLVRSSDGIAISLYLQGYGSNKRFTISGIYAHSLYGPYVALDDNYKPLEITASPTRPAEAIAKDIRRRLLAGVIEHTAKALQLVTMFQAQADAVQQAIQLLAQVPDTCIRPSTEFRRGKCSSPYRSGLANWNAEAMYFSGEVTVKIDIANLTPKQAYVLLSIADRWARVPAIALSDAI